MVKYFFSIFFIVFLNIPVKADSIPSISRGGMLYDRWYQVIDAPKPESTHPAWPKSNSKTGASTHRCKSCHGWDYKGKNGDYSTGKYMTGIKGIESYIGKEKKEIISILTNELHGFGDKMSTDDLNDLALFVSKGQVDFTKFIDPETNLVKIGNVEKGKEYFETVCAKCHGKDGKLIEDMAPLGKLAHKNPWEVLHKIINGQPGKKMPSLRAFDQDVVADIMSYIQTLKK